MTGIIATLIVSIVALWFGARLKPFAYNSDKDLNDYASFVSMMKAVECGAATLRGACARGEVGACWRRDLAACSRCSRSS